MEKTVQTIPFFRLLIALLAGIILGLFIHFPKEIIITATLFFLFLLILIQWYYNFRLIQFTGVIIHLFFICIGIFSFQHYNRKPVFFENGKFLATVLETPQEKQNSLKSIVKIDAFYLNDSVFKTNEKLLVYFEKTIENSCISAGDKIIFSQNPQTIRNNGNPFEFDYKKYLERKKIYRQVYLSSEKWKKTQLNKSNTLQILAENSREKLLKIYGTQNLGSNELEILSALTLGYKRELDPEIKQVFSAAGAMHVLAVSGLHVGIIYWILSLLFSFLKRQKLGRILFIFISITGLWIFAFITGLSPSVMRAATMFSFVIIGTGIKRQTNIYNTLAASAFFLLLINPNNLFDVGFQLSYSAVFGIVFLQPRFEKLIKIKNKFLNYFWILLTVSFAAQISTFPISIYYFNQFPTYFWITNLFVIPAVFILIPMGILLLIFSGTPIISAAIAFIVKDTISILYLLLQSIENFPFSIYEISIYPLELILIILMLLSFFLWLKKYRVIYLHSILLFVFLFNVNSLFHKIRFKHLNQIIIYNSQNQIIHLIAGKNNYIISEEKIAENDYDLSIIRNTQLKLDLNKPLFLTLKSSLENEHLFLKNGILFFQKKLIIIKIPTDKFLSGFTPDIILNPPLSENLSTLNFDKTTLISTRKLKPGKNNISLPVYEVKNVGAFQKKW